MNLTKQIIAPEHVVNADRMLLVYAGAVNPQDGVDYVPRVLSHLVHEIGRRDFLCLILGDGDSLEDVKALARDLELADYVRFTGLLPYPRMLSYLSAADICLETAPSNELNDVSTFIKIMEYMALGKPTVSFDLKETRVTAQDAAIYVTPNDEIEFAQAIAQLMDDPARRRRMGWYGRRRVEEELAWQNVSNNLLLAYQSVLPEAQQLMSIEESQRVTDRCVA